MPIGGHETRALAMQGPLCHGDTDPAPAKVPSVTRFQTLNYPVVIEERNALAGLVGLVLFALVGSLVVLSLLALALGLVASAASKPMGFAALAIALAILAIFALAITRLVTRAVRRSRGEARIRIDRKGLSYAVQGQAFDVDWASIKSIRPTFRFGLLMDLFFMVVGNNQSGVDQNEKVVEILTEAPVSVTTYPFGLKRRTDLTGIRLRNAEWGGETLLAILSWHHEANMPSRAEDA